MLESKRIAYTTLGCKLNFSETSALRRISEKADYTTVAFEDMADVYVINTCSVTDNADKKCRAVVRKAKGQNPEAKVVVVGCYAQLKPKEISAIDGVSMVLGAKEKFAFLDFLDQQEDHACGKVYTSEIDEVNEFVDAFSIGDRTRSFLKVQDGCDYKCAFCTIPLARGKSRSDRPENVLANAKKIVEAGVKEIVLTGVNTGDYGAGLDEQINFLDLIKRLDEEIDIPRIRISSIEPNLLTDEIIEFVATSKRFMPHFHVPLQSGSNTLLKTMRRRYKREVYTSRVEKIKSAMSHACIGVDVIVGFPQETEELFMETVNYLKELDISYLHAFTYSERNNTHALTLEGVVPMNVRHERSEILRSLSEKKKRYFYEQFVGEERTVLFESRKSDNTIDGFTDNYLKVNVPYKDGMENSLLQVKVGELNQNDLFDF